MSKKRFFGAITAVAVVLGSIVCPASAQGEGVTFSVADYDNDIIRLEIVNSAMDGKQVSLYIFNPGKSVSDLEADGSGSAKEALYQALILDFNGASLAQDVKIKAPSGDDHIYKYLIISQNGEKMSGEFEFYTKTEKDNLIKEINDAKGGTTVPARLAERIYKYFNLQYFDLFETVENKSKADEIFMEISKDAEITAENIAEFFENAVVTAAFCEGADGLIKDNKFAYMDYVGLDGSYLSYYNEQLSDEGMKKCVTNIFNKEYKTLSDVKANMEKEVVANAVNSNKLSGYGHIEQVIKDFEKDFADAGLELEKYNNKDKDKIGKKYMEELRGSSKSTLEDIADAINKIMKSLSESGSGSGGTGGTGGGSRGGSSGGSDKSKGQAIAPPVSTVNSEEKEQIKEVVFGDLEGFDWARASIETLFKKGIISGKEAGKFAPADNITREEFTVLLVNAFNITSDAAKADFDDVNASRWSYDYISRAYGAGVVSGDGRNFKPGEKITRQDIASILLRTLMKNGIIGDVKPKTGIFNDENDISNYAVESVQIMNELGVLNGYEDGCFKPKNSATRAECAVIIERALSLVK